MKIKVKSEPVKGFYVSGFSLEWGFQDGFFLTEEEADELAADICYNVGGDAEVFPREGWGKEEYYEGSLGALQKVVKDNYFGQKVEIVVFDDENDPYRGRVVRPCDFLYP